MLQAADESGAVPRVAVISDRFWRERFDADPSAIGTTLRAQDPGLAPAGASRPGVMPVDAASVLTGAVRRVEGADSTADAVVTPVIDYVTGIAKPVLWLMQAGAALMLLLACSSVAGLLVFRAARQDRALAMHLALGATRTHLLARTLLEVGLLATAGGLAALAVTWAVARALVAAAPLDRPRLDTVGVGSSVFVGLGVMVPLVAVLAAAWAAWFVSRVEPGPTLTTGARTAVLPRERSWQRLVEGWQVALAVVVLTGAALFVRSVAELDRTEPGFDPRGLTAVEIEPARQDLESWGGFYDALLARVRQVPGVRHAAAVYLRPLGGTIGMDGRPVPFGQEGLGPDAPWRANSRANLEAVTVVYFSTVPPQRSVGPPGQLRWMTVVGVLEDVRYRGVTDPRLDVYLPAAQSTMRVKHLMIRSGEDTGAPIHAVRALAREIDATPHVGEAAGMNEAVARETAPWRFAMRVLMGYGVLAAVLAGVGLTGMVSLAVTLRRRELGIRAALGATPRRLHGHVVGGAVGTVVVAITVGVIGALVLGRLLSALLVATPPHDLWSLAGAALVTRASGLIGVLRPARQAARTEVVAALRN